MKYRKNVKTASNTSAWFSDGTADIFATQLKVFGVFLDLAEASVVCALGRTPRTPTYPPPPLPHRESASPLFDLHVGS